MELTRVDPWGQIKGESQNEHLVFLVYLNLGVLRSVPKCWKACQEKRKSEEVSWLPTNVESMRELSKKRQWEARAWAFDKDTLLSTARGTVISYTRLLRVAAADAYQSIRERKCSPKNSADVCNLIETLAKFMPRETVQEMMQDRPPEKDPLPQVTMEEDEDALARQQQGAGI